MVTGSVPSKGRFLLVSLSRGPLWLTLSLFRGSEHQGQGCPEGNSCAGRSEGPRSWAGNGQHLPRAQNFPVMCGATGLGRTGPSTGQAMLGSWGHGLIPLGLRASAQTPLSSPPPPWGDLAMTS